MASAAASAAQEEVDTLAAELKAQLAASGAAASELQALLAAAEAAVAAGEGEVAEARQDLEVAAADCEARQQSLLELHAQVSPSGFSTSNPNRPD